MKRNLLPLLLFLLLTGLGSCSTPSSEEAMTGTATTVHNDQANTQEISTNALAAAPSAKIIKVANVRFQVKDLQASTFRLEQQLRQFNAFIFSSQNTNAEQLNEINYTIKVEPSQLDGLLAALQKESIQLDNLHVSSQDVTLEYVDVQARIKAKQAVEQRYLDLLQQASKIADVLAIEQELKKVQEEKEVMQARLKSLQHQTTYSTVHLSIYQVLPASFTDKPGFFTDAVSAVANGWQLCRGFILAILYLWPLWLIGSGIWLLYRRYNTPKSTLA